MSTKLEKVLFLKTSPAMWTFSEKDSSASCDDSVKWAWASFKDLRECVDNVRKATGRFPLPGYSHHPELFNQFGYLMTNHVPQAPRMLYSFLESGADRVHVDALCLHGNVDDLFVPMGWVNIVLKLVWKGVDKVHYEHAQSSTPILWAMYEGSELREQIINPRRKRMGWRLEGKW